MYNLLLVSTDSGFTNLSLKFIPHLQSGIRTIPVKTMENAMNTIEGQPMEVILFDHSADNDLTDFIKVMDRSGISVPIVLVARKPSEDVLSEALNNGIMGFVDRQGRDPLDYFKEICDRVVITAERSRYTADRAVNIKRMESLIEMAKMSDRGFSDIVDYALDTALELTHSEVGFVAKYDRDRRRLVMLAWSKGAMKRCDITNYPVEFPLDTTGVWGDPIRNGKPVIINDYEGDRRLLKKGIPEGHLRLNKILLVPVFAKDGGIIGTAGVANKKTDYTNTDQTQLCQLMDEMFAMFVRRDALKMYNAPGQIVKELTEVGPIGMAFVTIDMELAFLNRTARTILGIDDDVVLPVDVGSISTCQMQTISDLVNRIRSHGGMSVKGSITARINDRERSFVTTVYSTTSTEGMRPGFTIIMNDVTDLKRLDETATLMREHISILEGPVLDSLLTSRPFILLAKPLLSDDKLAAVNRINETILFMADYKNVGMNHPIWIDLEDAAREAKNYVVPEGIKLNLRTNGLKVLADPSFPSVFRQLLVNSILHGEYVTEITIRCAIVDGVLSIIYEDNGVGIDSSDSATLFDKVYEGKFGMFLIYNIISASGFKIRQIPKTSGASFEITVPSSKYSLG